MRESLPERWQVNRDLEKWANRLWGYLREEHSRQKEQEMQLSWHGNLLGVLLNVKQSCDALGLACSSHWKGSGSCCLCFSHNLWSSAFHRWRTEGSNMYPAPSLLHISEIRHEAFWSIMRESESLSVPATGMSRWMSAKQQRSVIMWESCLVTLVLLMEGRA